ncbi:AMP-binding protein [Halomonas sp. 3H]|uniref:AMP-binding protein n=1 Tax=Halomonas sp. 3H TaxID=2952527 RepID=UPI0020B7AF60|nr:AMP-binding protein [Halomonas sp. 3H]
MTWEPITIGAALRRTAESYPDRPAVIGEHSRLSFGELDRMVDEVAAGLIDVGIQHGDNVAVWVANSPEWVAIWMACARIGAVLVPVNTRFKTREARYVLQQSNASVLIMMDQYWDIDFFAMAQEMVPGLDTMEPGSIVSDDLPALRSIILWNDVAQPGTSTLNALRERGRGNDGLAQREVEVSVDDTVIIVYTSGTTGNPKGAMHSHVMLRNAANVAREMHIEPGERILGHMPFYHIAGTVTEVLPCILLGCTLVTMSKWDPDKAMEIIARERVNFLGGIPTHFIDCIDVLRKKPYDTSCLKSAWIGGAPVTPDVARAAFEIMQLDALQAVYGMTETTSTTVLSEFDAPLEVLFDNKGKPVGEFEVIVVDARSGEKLPADAVGEVWVRGHIVMQGYYRNPEATREVITEDGFFRTGDLGCFDRQGYLKITGRVKDMFIVGGTNAYPAEIERIIQGHDAVKQAIVVGVPHQRLGEVGFAYVQLAENAALTRDELLVYCSSNMADYKVPRFVQFADEFPRTPTGKIQRFVLAEQAREKSRNDSAD